MSRTYDEIREDALKLSIEERSWLIDELWESTLSEEQRSIQAEWLDEAERRLDEIEAGTAKTIPWEEVLQHMREAVERARRDSRTR